MKDRIEIKASKTKLYLLLFGALVFVALGLYFIIWAEALKSNPINPNPNLLRVVGGTTVVFFGYCGYVIFGKLTGDSTGLIIDENGITDFSSGTSVGLIEWQDIKEVRKANVLTTKFLMLITDNPDKYISRANNSVQKSAMKSNLKLYGSPLSITTNTLQVSFDDLEKLLQTKMKEADSHNN